MQLEYSCLPRRQLHLAVVERPHTWTLDLHLAAAALNDSEHVYRLLADGGKTLDYHGSGLDLNVYRAPAPESWVQFRITLS